MSAIARILADRGPAGVRLRCQGLARADRAGPARRADRRSATAPANLDLLDGGPTAVVVSTAIRPDNAEVVEARERGIPVVRRADALAALMAGHRSVCVAGTHGKTSTTSMLTVALQRAGLDPSFAIGGELNESRLRCAPRDRRHLRRRGRRVGRFVPGVRAARRDHHQPRARPPRPPRHRRCLRRRVRPVRRPDPARRVPGRLRGRPGPVRLVEQVQAAAGVPRIVRYGFEAGADVRIASTRPAGHGSRRTIRSPDGDAVRLHRRGARAGTWLSNADGRAGGRRRTRRGPPT